MPRVVILGAGFGGLAAAYRLRRLAPQGTEVVVVADAERYFYRPSLPQVALGARRLQDVSLPIAEVLPRKGIEFLKGRVQEIRPASRTVITDAQGIEYDYLLVALGSEIAFDEVKGLREHGHVLCEAEYILRLREALEVFRGGPVAVVLTRDNPFELMDIGFALDLDHLLRRRGLRPRAEIHYFTPNEVILPHLGEKARGLLLGIFAQRGIVAHTGMHLREAIPQSVLFADGVQFPSSLTVLIPPYRGRRVVAASELGDARGYIATDDEMKSLKFANVYAVGDSVGYDGPKSGRRAVKQGQVAAHNIARRIRRQSDAVRFADREVRCIVELGGRRAAYIHSDAFWGGHRERVWVGRIPYWMKLWLEKWFILRKGDI